MNLSFISTSFEFTLPSNLEFWQLTLVVLPLLASVFFGKIKIKGIKLLNGKFQLGGILCILAWVIIVILKFTNFPAIIGNDTESKGIKNLPDLILIESKLKNDSLFISKNCPNRIVPFNILKESILDYNKIISKDPETYDSFKKDYEFCQNEISKILLNCNFN
jgi:hypothetical protein